MEIEATKRKRALVVDDNIMIQKVHSSQLEQLNYDVELAGTGEEAIAQLRKNSFDVVLLDINLPTINGYEVCRIIREDLKNKSIPIMGVTTITAKDIQDKYLQVGMNDVYTKPILTQDLKAFLEKFVK